MHKLKNLGLPNVGATGYPATVVERIGSLKRGRTLAKELDAIWGAVAAPPLRGRTVAVVGDDLSLLPGGWQDIVRSALGVELVNLSEAGSGYMAGYEPAVDPDPEDPGDQGTPAVEKAFRHLAAQVPEDADAVLLVGGFNDLGYDGYDLGTPSDDTDATACGCVNLALDAAVEAMAGAGALPVLGVVLPPPAKDHLPSDDTDDLALYCAALSACAAARSVPVLDLFTGSNLQPGSEACRALEYDEGDDVCAFPNADGHSLLAPQFKAFLERLIG